MSYETGTHIPLHTRAELAHREVQLIADRSGVRVLHFKGPFAVADFPDRGSGQSDADVLCAPASAATLAAAMQTYGWTRATTTATDRITLLHPERGVSIDLYEQPAGIRGDWETLFPLLWRARRTITEGFPSVAIPSFLDHAALLLAEVMIDDAKNQRRQRRNRLAVESQIPTARRTEFYQRLRQLTLLETVYPTGGLTKSSPQRRRLRAINSPLPLRRTIGAWAYRIADAPDVKAKIAAACTRSTDAAPPPQPPAGDTSSRIANDVVWTINQEDSVAALCLTCPAPVLLLGSAQLVWKLLAVGSSDDEVVQIIMQEVTGVPPQAADQIRQTIASLAELRLIEAQ